MYLSLGKQAKRPQMNEAIDMLNLKLDVILKEISLLRGDQRLFHEDIGNRISSRTTSNRIQDSCKIINFNQDKRHVHM